jgi:S-methylmethionine-dependent homocysteine/selenocysteine methylase
MALYRNALPQIAGTPFITDGGLETTLVFQERIDLPAFAAFPLVLTEAGRSTLERYFVPYLNEAISRNTGFVPDTATWRANPDWGRKLGYGPEALREANRQAVEFAADLRNAYATSSAPIVVNGVIGPRGDGYVVADTMSPAAAQEYHRLQMEAFRDGDTDMVSAVTMTYADEAIGIARAASDAGLPVAVSFTVETDGRLPSGQPLREAIKETDAGTASYPAYYMINCAHPDHIMPALAADGIWVDRVRGLRANASRKSHAELDAATELDSGNPDELGRQYRDLRMRLRQLCVFGGCCGTDHRHVRAICAVCLDG